MIFTDCLKVASLLSGLFLCAVSCTAWQYETEACDPKNGIAGCMKLNSGKDLSKDCMLFQCDRTTSTCQLKPKDIDQDGDPDPICPGGTDCNDSDSRYSGVAQTCGCNLAGQPCKAGVGACAVELKTECLNNSLSCPRQMAPSFRSDAWQSEPADVRFASGEMYKSWDWDCDGSGDGPDNTERNCNTDPTSAPRTCEQTDCTGIDLSKTPDEICVSYCSRMNNTDCNNTTNTIFYLNCAKTCGSNIYTCRCNVSLYSGNKCSRWIDANQNKYQVMVGKVYCR